MKPGFQTPSAAGRLPDAGPPRPSGGSRAGPLTLRLVLSLALFPIVPSSSFLFTYVVDKCWSAKPTWLDELQSWMLAGTVAVTLLSLWIWRACVVWTAGRYAGTVMAAAVPIAQVLWWRPLWPAGCVSDDVLRGAQTLGMGALWGWVTVWLWWGWTKLGPSVGGRVRMTPYTRRVLLSLGTIPLVVGVYSICWVFFEDILEDTACPGMLYGSLVWSAAVAVLLGAMGFATARLDVGVRVIACLMVVTLMVFVWGAWGAGEITRDEIGRIALANGLAGAVALVSWLVIWRSTVLWDRRAHLTTALLGLAFLATALLGPVIFGSLNGNWAEILMVTLPLMAWGAWMIATMLLWRFRPAELPGAVEERLRCRSCGYRLKGLYATRCPECGHEPTLEELVAGVLGASDA